MKSFVSRPQAAPLALLFILCLAFWGRVLFTANVLLPGEMLRGFQPFGGDGSAPWTILQWDALAQYFPWRHFAAQSLREGTIPLWNDFQFTGTPFLANAQSAVLYPLNLPFWILDTAYAFGVSAFIHSLLASFSTYFLARRWKLSRPAAVLSGVAYAFCGYLTAWALLPTLFATAAWLPLCLLLFEKASDDAKPGIASYLLVVSLCCALLAGHAQIFFYILLALGLRQPFLQRKWRGLGILLAAIAACILLSAAQLLPTIELARDGHRAGELASPKGWNFVQERALHPTDFLALIMPDWPSGWGSLNENFGYIGVGLLVMALAGIGWMIKRGRMAAGQPPLLYFGLALALFGLLYALATPLAQFFYYGIPGVSQMGGTGRVLLLWSLGAALLAGFGLDLARRKIKSPVLPLIALLAVCAELFGNAFITQPTSPRAAIYPPTELTSFLAKNSAPNARVLMMTPRGAWLPTEFLQRNGRAHPPGILPPNGAMVYGIHDVNGYDSLSLRVYRAWINSEETEGSSPQLNGNMVLVNSLSPALLDSLAVRYVVTLQSDPPSEAPGKKVLSANGCDVWQRNISGNIRVSGANFATGWREGKYQPTSFRFGAFLSLCMLGFLTIALVCKWKAVPSRAAR
jgi:hypothetical protein